MPSRSLGPQRFLAVAGNIGAGKSTLVRFLSEQYGLEAFYEPNESNPYLEDFYRDMRRWAFASQVYFLTAKFRMHQTLARHPSTVVQDRTIYEDAEVFAENLYRSRRMTKRDYQTYRALYEGLVEELRPPNLMIYLRCPESVLKRRIRDRGRPSEQNLPRGYLARLQRLYDDWFARYDLSETLVVDTSQIDYLEDWVDRLSLLDGIEAAIR